MSIAEKLQTIAENEQKVYESGYEKGKAEGGDIDEDKIVSKTVSAKGLLNIPDVSEIPHKIKLKLTSDTITDFSNTKVTVCGKNLCYTNTCEVGKVTNPIWQGDLNGIFSLSFTNNLVDIGSPSAAAIEWISDGNKGNCGANIIQAVIRGNLTKINWLNWCAAKSGSLDEIQLEVGYNFTGFEPYNATEYIANADGTLEIQSGNTIMNIITDSNINIEAIYNVSWGAKNTTDYFWNSFQQTGKRTEYGFAFSGKCWNMSLFKPKYDIKPKVAKYMFYETDIIGDLVELCNNLGITIDFSQCANLEKCFSNDYWGKPNITRIGVIDFSSNTSAYHTFEHAQALITIDKLIFHSGMTFDGTFSRCYALENIVIEGTIANSIYFGDSSKLTHDSIESVINALSTDTSDKTVSFSLSAVNKAFETSEGAADGSTSDEWTNLIATKPNWTITLQ